MPHFVRRDIFAFAKVILRLCRSDILFTINTRKANITRLKAVYHCVAIELAVRRIELKKALAIASAIFLVGAGGPELRSAFVCFANLRFIDLWFSSTLFYIKITNRKSGWLFLVGAGGFEPPKSSTTDLQSAPFGHSGTLPHKFILFSQNNGAGGRT